MQEQPNASKKQHREALLKAALLRGPEYYQYKKYPIPVDNPLFDRYQIMHKIGSGKFSDVYKAVLLGQTREQDTLAVLKVLKPVSRQKVQREVKIIKSLKHESIIELQGVLFDQYAKKYMLAFEYVQSEVFTGESNFQLTEDELKFYLRKLLEGLNYCHSQGIMHRDIKPDNILINRSRKLLKIIDWGLAEYYLPKRQYDLRVATRFYRGPELLLNNPFYDYSIDIWAVGCWFAGLVFMRSAFFKGDDNISQFKKIFQIFGTADIQNYVQKYGLKPDNVIKDCLKQQTPKYLFEVLRFRLNFSLATPPAMDLLKRLLVIDHNQRLTAAEALAHPYLTQPSI